MSRVSFLSPAFVLAAVLALAPGAGSGEQRAWTGEEIRHALSGNSIVHPDFGCVFFRPDGGTEMHYQDMTDRGFWEIRNNLYISSGRCGEVGCKLSGAYPELKFRRVDGEYEQDAIVILGNHCKKDGIVS
jgi:hypothetical protein